MKRKPYRKKSKLERELRKAFYGFFRFHEYKLMAALVLFSLLFLKIYYMYLMGK